MPQSKCQKVDVRGIPKALMMAALHQIATRLFALYVRLVARWSLDSSPVLSLDNSSGFYAHSPLKRCCQTDHLASGTSSRSRTVHDTASTAAVPLGCPYYAIGQGFCGTLGDEEALFSPSHSLQSSIGTPSPPRPLSLYAGPCLVHQYDHSVYLPKFWRPPEVFLIRKYPADNVTTRNLTQVTARTTLSVLRCSGFHSAPFDFPVFNATNMFPMA
jgi:hypothetical protein